MYDFSMRNAWSFGLQFLGGRLLLHIAFLLGIGILPGFALQYAAGDAVGGASGPAAADPTGLGATAAAGTAAILVMLGGYVLQTGSYFASWRIGLRRDAGPIGAIGFGLVCGLIAAGVFALLIGAATMLPEPPMTMGAFLLAVALFLLPFAAAFALFYTLLAALVAVGLTVLLALAMAFGAATGNIGFAATLVGGSGLVAVILIVLSMVMLWLAARLSCVASIMAERGSFNLPAAIAESWRLTWEEQWVIFRYLGLIGFGLFLLFAGLAFAAGYGMATFGDPVAVTDQQAAGYGMIIGIALGLPLALLSVLVPAGIYRELDQGAMTAEVFT